MSDTTTVRGLLHDTLQSTIAIDHDMPDGAMLLGWVAIAEWMAPDGNRWLSIVDGNTNREGCPVWQRQGHLHNTLFDAQGFIPDDEEDDDG